MTKIESSIREIAYPQQSVYNLLSDLSNIDKVRDRIPSFLIFIAAFISLL